jgi:hypothetical protein
MFGRQMSVLSAIKRNVGKKQGVKQWGFPSL